MRGLKKSKRVSWPSDVNLCQAKLFLSEESPSQVGLVTQDHLQPKLSWLLHPSGTASDDVLPPGFEGVQPADQFQINISNVPVIKWKLPPRLVIDVTWQVVAGGESKEVDNQSEREMRVLEAVYPRPSAIPPNPVIPATVDDSQQIDQNAIPIPITPIEDEDAADALGSLIGSSDALISTETQQEASSVPGAPNTSFNGTISSGALDVEPDVLAAASAAFFSALNNKSSEQGTLIDHDLLVKILSNSKLIEKLVADSGAASQTLNTPNPNSFVSVSNIKPPQSDAHWFRVNGTESSVRTSSSSSSGGPFYPRLDVGAGSIPPARTLPQGFQNLPAPSVAPPPHPKDMSYYKNLIQQHGAERQEAPPPPPTQQFGNRHGRQLQGRNQEPINTRSRDLKPKVMKPCIYFNSPRGCRNGINCAFQHDPSFQQKDSNMSETQSGKRMKMDREISS